MAVSEKCNTATWDTRPIIAISMGDPAGIGAEIAVKALKLEKIYSVARPVIVGDLDAIQDAVDITGGGVKVNVVSEPEDGAYRFGTIDLIDLNNIGRREVEYGKVDPRAGKAAYEYVEKAIKLALSKKADAVVTGPINKEAINLAGYHYSGHTEIFAALTGTKDYAMMLADGDFRVVHVTTHVSLRKACDLIKRERVLTVIRLTDNALKRLGIARPRIGVAGLNPHAGESGLFGMEEIEEIIPAISDAAKEGIVVDGPIPPDTLFAKARSGQYDAAVAMYHDQGHIAMKTASFTLDPITGKWLSVSGVNVTLGLPIIRVSVDHGTAFGKAGKGLANPESLVQAIILAARFASAGRQI